MKRMNKTFLQLILDIGKTFVKIILKANRLYRIQLNKVLEF